MRQSEAEILAVCEGRLPLNRGQVVAIEGLWDGDSSGWWLELLAITLRDGKYDEHRLKILEDPAGDMRLFNGQVPPWPEAELGSRVGAALAARLGVPFHFPASDRPDDSPPRFAELAEARKSGLLVTVSDRSFLCWTWTPPFNTYYEPPAPMLRVVAEDLRFQVLYALGQAARDNPYLVIAGNELPGLDNPQWRRLRTPRWEDDAEMTPAFTTKLVEWCMSTDKEIVRVDYRGLIRDAGRGV